MKVHVLPGQEDISTPSLGDLQFMLEKALIELEAADQEELAARSRTTAARNTVSDLQRQINTGIALLKQTAPRSTPWADERL